LYVCVDVGICQAQKMKREVPQLFYSDSSSTDDVINEKSLESLVQVEHCTSPDMHIWTDTVLYSRLVHRCILSSSEFSWAQNTLIKI
jgi:ABC-type Zn uptake system ZnuABC Zn-binding protein ZnuA